jgi:hypothetical protein
MDDEDKIITEEEKKKLTEQVTKPILKEAEERMIAGVRTRKPVKPLTRQEQIEATPEGQIPQRLRPGAPTSDRIELPTTLPQHGVKALYNDGERILERASHITNLPPESPFTHTIAHRIAKGDPFSSEALEEGKKETMKLVRAGIIPNPNYEGFSGKVQQAYEMFAPLVVEVGLPMMQGIATSPLLISPVPGSRPLYFGGLGATSGVANMWAQQMRIGYGHQEETSYQEAAAAMAWGMIPGVKTGKDMSKSATVVLRGFEGAVMAGGENATHQGLELLYGKRGEFKVGELGLTSAGGAAIGGVLGRLESALVKYEPKEKAAPLLRKAIKDELRGARKELARLKKAGQRRGLKTYEAKIAKLEKKFNDLREPEDKILQRAIDELEEFEQQQVEAIESYAKEFQQSKAAEVLKESDVKAEAPAIEAPTPKPEGEVKQQAREALDDFMAGGGTRDVDPETGKILDTEDEVKARLLTSDAEKQRLINSVQDAIKEDLKNVKGGREGQVEYLAKVQRELDRRLGTDMGEEFALVLKAAQLSDNIEVADAINELSIQMSANGAIMVKGFDDLLKLTREKDFNNPEDLNDAMVSMHKLIPQMLGWKKAGSAAGRLLQSRKYTKDQLEMKVEQLETQMEENLVNNLKSSKDMTPEELDKQIKTFGDIEAVKRLLKAVQQSNDVSEVKDILIKQQQAFQNKSTLKKNFEQGANLYTKVRDAGMDVLYSSMLSAPTTLIKVGLGNAVMSRYNSWMGKVGAKYMALNPYARRGMTKQQFEEAYDFWARVSTTYGEFNDIALQEARKAFKSGISDLRSHFERVGESALSMERTGLNGALGQSLENVGQFIDVPGKAMAAIDARSRMRIAHAMTKAKAVYDYRIARANGEEVPDNFDAYYKGFLNRVFTEDGTRLMTEDQARRQAILNAEKEGVKAENMASYIENYLKNNWDKNTSNFVDYVQRNVKEVTFTDELGEFANMTWAEKGALKPIENLLASFPLLKTIISPFQRTGRNIIREGLSTTSALADVPGIRKFSDQIWAKTTQDLNSGDPIIAARAKGRQIVGAGIIATAWGMAEAGLYQGMIGQNWKKRENVEIGTGLSDYQLRIPVGDEVLAQDINALEPFATVLNIVADIHTLSKGSMAQRKEAMTALGILQLVVSNNIGNKSYFKNLGDAIELVTATSESEEALDAKRSRLLKGMFGSAVPSAMNAMSMATDDFRRRSDNMMQLLGKRIGGIAREVPPYRDMFGDPQPLHKTDRLKAFSLFNPFRVSKQIMDVEDYVVTDEDGLRSFNKEKLAGIDLKEKVNGKPNPNYNEEAVRNAAWAIAIELDGEYHFNGGTTTKDGVDLQEIVHPETRIDAFEAWQKEYQTIKLDGLNVKQATVLLGKKLTTPTKLNPNKAPEGFKQEDFRLKKLNQMLGKFREVAYKKVKMQYPVLMEQEKENKVRNILLTTSPNAKQLERITSDMPVEEYKKTQPSTRLQELLGKTPYKAVTLD